MIELWLNNEKCKLAHTMPLSDALNQWENSGLINGRAFAVAVNTAFVPRSGYTDVILTSGDRIELVIPMQGG